GDTCIDGGRRPRSASTMTGWRSSPLPRGCTRLQLRKRAAKRVVREHRALQARRADVDSEEVEEVVRSEVGDLLERLALDLVGQQRRRGLADRAATAGGTHAFDDAVLDGQLEGDPVAAQGIRPLARHGCVVQRPKVVWPPVVLEDVVAVEIVHAGLRVYPVPQPWKT